MTVRLTVHGGAWRAHVGAVAAACPGLVPVVKGNGYGFGRPNLHVVAAAVSTIVAVGTIHELHDVPPELVPVVLTPALEPPRHPRAAMTVGAIAHVEALRGWTGDVLVKLQSSMRRYGCTPDELPALVEAVRAAGLRLAGYSIHLPLAGSDDDHRSEIETWLPLLPTEAAVWVSHLSIDAFTALRTAHRDRPFCLRLGTALWHGDKSTLQLQCDVLDVRPVQSGERAGYRLRPVPGDGHVVLVGAGTAHGVHPLADGRSPFHHARHRLDLVEPPHMHTSMVFVADGQPLPVVGDWVDVQRPLTTTTPDQIHWIEPHE
jgi:alanine racemase